MGSITIGANSIPFVSGLSAYAGLEDIFRRRDADRLIVISDETVWPLHGAALLEGLGKARPVCPLLIAPGESEKCFSTLEDLCERAMEAGATRRSMVVAFGGGVVGNLAGLTAALLFRGIGVVYAPTTLLAASDSVISFKSAVNSRRAKNAFGAYIIPDGIAVDPQVFATLPLREVLSGFAELAKNAMAVSPRQEEELRAIGERAQPWPVSSWERLVQLGIEAKLDVMKNDPHEGGRAIVFEYGHTFGHAIELVHNRLRGANGLSHGAAVAIGMHIAAQVSERLGIATSGLAARHRRLLENLGLPHAIPPEVCVQDLLSLALMDNKRGRILVSSDEIAMVLLEAEGKVAGPAALPLLPVPVRVVADVLNEIAAFATADG